MSYYYQYFNGIYKSTFDATLLRRYLTISPIILGIIVGLPSLLKQFRLKGSWAIDWIKLIIIGLPTLYINFAWYINQLGYYIGVFLVPDFIHQLIFYNGDSIRFLSGFILGYIILDSFKKKETEI